MKKAKKNSRLLNSQSNSSQQDGPSPLSSSLAAPRAPHSVQASPGAVAVNSSQRSQSDSSSVTSSSSSSSSAASSNIKYQDQVSSAIDALRDQIKRSNVDQSGYIGKTLKSFERELATPFKKLSKSDDPEALKESLEIVKKMQEAVDEYVMMRDELNQRAQSSREAEYKAQEDKGKIPDRPVNQRRVFSEEQAKRFTNTSESWGAFGRDLQKLSNETTFVQAVPSNSKSLEAIKSQNIFDAIYNGNKAFWIAAKNGAYKLNESSKDDFVYIQYDFPKEFAKDLVLNSLVDGSSTHDGSEPFKGESQHPEFTIVKTNEVGAFGVGYYRLQDLVGKYGQPKIRIISKQDYQRGK
ncbi:hypothetical protein [Pleionea sediminis]|uniref:hypothetical protein n=1 Tax=Pleionea sediminis TaxID=2569479 RepID=UPI0011858FE5|nr:hypothetical protein [Pleionea sediminis]